MIDEICTKMNIIYTYNSNEVTMFNFTYIIIA